MLPIVAEKITTIPAMYVDNAQGFSLMTERQYFVDWFVDSRVWRLACDGNSDKVRKHREKASKTALNGTTAFIAITQKNHFLLGTVAFGDPISFSVYNSLQDDTGMIDAELGLRR